MGYDRYTVPDTVAVEPTFVTFPLAFVNIRLWPLVPFFQISLKNTVNSKPPHTFPDCRMHFFRQLTFLEIAVQIY